MADDGFSLDGCTPHHALTTTPDPFSVPCMGRESEADLGKYWQGKGRGGGVKNPKGGMAQDNVSI